MVIYIYGSDTYNAAEKFKELKQQFLEKVDPSGINFSCFSGKSFDLRGFLSTATSFPFMAKRRMILVKNLIKESKSKEIPDKLATKMDEFKKLDNIIVFLEETKSENSSRRGSVSGGKKNSLHNILLKQKYVHVFNEMSGTALNKWVDKKVTSYGLKIGHQEIELLLGCTGSNFWALSSEIEKLVSYARAKNRDVIEKKDIGLLVNSESNTNIFSLVDAIGRKDKKGALKILNNLIDEGAEPIYLLAMLSMQFRNLLCIKDNQIKRRNPKELQDVLKLHPFVISKTSAQAQNFEYDSLVKVYKSLLSLDKRIKRGSVNIHTLYNLLVFCI